MSPQAVHEMSLEEYCSEMGDIFDLEPQPSHPKWGEGIGVFSCNPGGVVVPCEGQGYHGPYGPEDDVSGASVILQMAARALLDFDTKGGRFFVQSDGIYVGRGGHGRCILEFKLRDHPRILDYLVSPGSLT